MAAGESDEPAEPALRLGLPAKPPRPWAGQPSRQQPVFPANVHTFLNHHKESN
jgi:hypothetical protein